MSGYIRRRGKRSWTVQIELDRDETGKRHRRTLTVRGTKKEAERALTRALRERDTGVGIDPDQIRVGEFLADWLSTDVEPRVSGSTRLRYAQSTTRISRLLGDVRLQNLRPQQISRAYATLSASGLSARTVLSDHKTLSQALARAVEHRLLAINPAATVRPPRPVPTEVRSLTAEEVEQLLAAASDPETHTLIFLAANTGARIGELMALRWGDLDDDRLRIQRTAVYLPGRGVNFGPPKTRASRRQIRLSAECVAALSEHRVRQLERRLLLGAAYQDHDLIFAGPLGHVQAPKVVSRRFSAVVKRTGLQRCTFHTLRHTCATLGLIEGVNVKVMQERLGHASSAITLDLYSHTTEDMQAEAAELIGAQIRRVRAK